MAIATKLKAFRAMRRMDNGWQLILNRLFFSSETVQICRYKGLEFITDLSGGDANGARELLTSDEYRKFLGSMELSGALRVLDMGANNGGFPLLLASEGYRFEKLVCVEMNPQTATRLAYNLRRNFPGSGETVNAAVCGYEREISLTPSKGGTSENIYSGTEGPESITIRGRTADSIIEEAFGDSPIDLCKMDVEGAEFEIFKSDAFERVRQCRYFLIEIHHFPETPRFEVIERIEGAGFRRIEPVPPDDDGHHVHLFGRVE
ncbi:MAG: FkbM family methyltransferase [Acidobacteriota bacterium]|nr:MAG: FkbM family methyltransferase [Acidobacteriota bacterium]